MIPCKIKIPKIQVAIIRHPTKIAPILFCLLCTSKSDDISIRLAFCKAVTIGRYKMNVTAILIPPLIKLNGKNAGNNSAFTASLVH